MPRVQLQHKWGAWPQDPYVTKPPAYKHNHRLRYCLNGCGSYEVISYCRPGPCCGSQIKPHCITVGTDDVVAAAAVDAPAPIVIAADNNNNNINNNINDCPHTNSDAQPTETLDITVAGVTTAIRFNAKCTSCGCKLWRE